MQLLMPVIVSKPEHQILLPAKLHRHADVEFRQLNGSRIATYAEGQNNHSKRSRFYMLIAVDKNLPAADGQAR